MAKKKRVRKPSELSLAQLQQLVANKASELDDLRSKRAALQKELDELDQLINQTAGTGARKAKVAKKTATGGSPAATATKPKKKVARKKKGTRAKNKKSAKAYAVEVLKNQKDGLSLEELSKAVLDAGYKSNSVNFSNTLYQSLYNDRKAGKTFDTNKAGKWILR